MMSFIQWGGAKIFIDKVSVGKKITENLYLLKTNFETTLKFNDLMFGRHI